MHQLNLGRLPFDVNAVSLNSFKRELAMLVLYDNVCRIFVFVSLFGYDRVFLDLSISFFFEKFLVVVGANEMYNQFCDPFVVVLDFRRIFGF